MTPPATSAQLPPVTAKSPALTPPMFAPVSVIDPLVALLFTVRFNVLDAVWYTLAKTSFAADRRIPAPSPSR